jgi:DNA-binding GntR family transcriptional regulator
MREGQRRVNRKLADKIGYSMTSIREAINKLASEGLIDQVPGSGTFVRTLLVGTAGRPV